MRETDWRVSSKIRRHRGMSRELPAQIQALGTAPQSPKERVGVRGPAKVRGDMPKGEEPDVCVKFARCIIFFCFVSFHCRCFCQLWRSSGFNTWAQRAQEEERSPKLCEIVVFAMIFVFVLVRISMFISMNISIGTNIHINKYEYSYWF